MCYFSAEGTGRGRWAALKGKTSASSRSRLSCPHASCDGSSSLGFQGAGIGGGVLASFALLKVFLSRLDPT